MAKLKTTKTDTPAAIPEGQSPQELLQSVLKQSPGDHYNFEEEVVYKVSTGSLNMDEATGGGIGPGLFSVQGPFETGKTSFTLACMKNMLDTVPNSRGFYIRAESRLSAEMRARSGIKFVFTAEEWVDGTCFVLETNIYEFALNAMRSLVSNNPQQKRYFFFIDSMDGMTLKDDMAKPVGTADKVAGAPALTKKFLQKMANAMAKRGHICCISGQISADIKLDQYSPASHPGMPGGGGNAKNHFSNFIFIFRARTQDDRILEHPELKNPDRLKNRIIGHQVKIQIKKSPNEQSESVVTYPVRYGRSDGRSVWIEYEIVDMCLIFTLFKVKGSWLQMEDVLHKELEEHGFTDVPVQLQGVDQWRTYLESQPALTKYLFDKFVGILAARSVSS